MLKRDYERRRAVRFVVPWIASAAVGAVLMFVVSGKVALGIIWGIGGLVGGAVSAWRRSDQL
jgi:hypothetical protein